METTKVNPNVLSDKVLKAQERFDALCDAYYARTRNRTRRRL